ERARRGQQRLDQRIQIVQAARIGRLERAVAQPQGLEEGGLHLRELALAVLMALEVQLECGGHPYHERYPGCAVPLPRGWCEALPCSSCVIRSVNAVAIACSPNS